MASGDRGGHQLRITGNDLTAIEHCSETPGTASPETNAQDATVRLALI